VQSRRTTQPGRRASDKKKPFSFLPGRKKTPKKKSRKKVQGSIIKRVFMGGKLGDAKRVPRYLASAVVGATAIWVPLIGYLDTAPLVFTSTTSLILPGSGASASLNVTGIGQASSFANSAFASNSVSPTETYKRLLSANRIIDAAAQTLDIPRDSLGRPRVNLVDRTSLIHVEISGPSPEEAQAKGAAILQAFFHELDALRADELNTREDSGAQAIADYRVSVAQTRAQISALQNASGLVSASQYDVLLDRNLALQKQILDRRALLVEKRAGVAALEMRLGLDAFTAVATLKLYSDSGYLALRAEVDRAEVSLSEESALYGMRHPRVEAARNARDGAENRALRLAQSITGLNAEMLSTLSPPPQGARSELLAQLVQMQVALAASEEEMRTLQNQLDTSQSEIELLAETASDLQDLERDFSVAEAVFASAIARAQSTKSDVYASYPLVQVLEDPSIPQLPSSPNRKLVLAAGFAATIMLFIGLSLGWVRLALISRILAKPTPSLPK
jgi:uncharacterized protein involved in exopolysaccharide biosynthesis